jgi:hypothetical protein
MINQPTTITYDFEGDADDIREYERSLRRMHPADKYPLFVDEDDIYDEESIYSRNRDRLMQWDVEEDEDAIEEHERSLGLNYDDWDWVDYIDHTHLYRPRQCRWAYSFNQTNINNRIRRPKT